MNDNITETSSKINDFCKNMKSKYNIHSDAHNTYVLQTKDMDGNITGEAFGMNLFTDYGLYYIYYKSAYNYIGNGRIYIGNSTDVPTLDSQTMNSLITTTPSTDADRSCIEMPFKYDKTNDLMIGTAQVYYGYFNYNITDITTPQTITEIGYGNDENNLFSHSLIYDIDGNISSITKNINERLYITMYWSFSCKSSIISNAYDNNKYILLNPVGLIRHFNEPGRYDNYQVSFFNMTRKVYSNLYNYGGHDDPKPSPPENHKYLTSVNLGEILLQDKYSQNLFVMFKLINYFRDNNPCDYYKTKNSKYLIMIPTKLSTPEEITTTDFYVNELQHWTNEGTNIDYTDALIKANDMQRFRGTLPCVNFNTTSMHMYNHLTKDWDIEETFTDCSNTDYTNSMLTGIELYGNFGGKNRYVYVYCNTNTSIPIERFNNDSLTIYASDTYWDSDSWILIDDIKNITSALQTKRYYIVFDINDIQLLPYRTMTRHKITNVEPSYLLPVHTYTKDENTYRRALSSENYNWVCFDTDVIYPLSENKNVYPILNVSTGKIFTSKECMFRRWNIDDTIIIALNKLISSSKYIYNILYLYTISNDPTIAPISSEYELIFDTVLTGYPVYSFSDCGTNGYLVAQSEQSNEAVVMTIHNDVDGLPKQSHLTNVKFTTVIFMTDNVVYQKITDDSICTFEIYNVTSDTVVSTFSLPEGYTTEGMIGWKNYIYIRTIYNGIYSTYVYNINNDELIYLPDNDIALLKQPVGNTTYDIRAHVYNDECLILNGRLLDSRTTDDTSTTSCILTYNNPTDPIYITDVIDTTSAKLAYVNNGKQLLMSCGYSSAKYVYNYNDNNGNDWRYETIYPVIDIGLLIDGGDFSLAFYRWCRARNWSITKTFSDLYFTLFKNGAFWEETTGDNTRWFPIEEFVQHKITGTTTVPNAFNNPKNIKCKTIDLTISNLIE